MPHRVGPLDDAVATALTRALAAALDGTGPAVAPHSPEAAAPTADHVPDGVAVVLATSGSTGRPRHLMLDADALRASAAATRERLGGPARWVLALPPAHVAGVQVLVRSLLDGTTPVVVPAGGFRPAALAHAARRAGPGTRTSLVPTQVHRIVTAARAGGLPPGDLAALRSFDAILVGGAATDPGLLTAARDLGLRVVTTYGMTETCGGCVYDGVALPGVRVRAGVPGEPAPIAIAGPVLARGHLAPELDDESFVTDAAGVRWHVTRDLGVLAGDRLTVAGRVDDVIVTGGHKVAPLAVEAALGAVAGVGRVCVVGVPDPQWGRVVTAVVVPAPGTAGPVLEDLRAAARSLGGAAAPRRLLLIDDLPERGPGKVDRAAVTAWAATAVDAPPRTPGP